MTPSPGRRRPIRPRLGRRVVRGLKVLLRAQDGNLLVVSATAEPGRRGEYERAVRYLERLVAWSEERRSGAPPAHTATAHPRRKESPR